MALLERVMGIHPSQPKISPHSLYAMLRELARGEINRQYIINNLNLDTNDISDLDWLIAQYQAQPDATAKELWMQGLWGIILLAEQQFSQYSSQAEVVARINTL